MKTFITLLAISFCCGLFAQTVIPLYAGLVPNAKAGATKEKIIIADDGGPRVSKVTDPTLTMYLPPKERSNGTAVIICPGGGYVRLSIKKEGDDVAKAFNEWGVTAFVLKYRLPDDSIMQQKEIGPLQDAQRAMQVVRSRATEWNIDPHKIGIMGFSAGGHLASTLGTHFKKAAIFNKPKTNLRPDFMVLMYPVISFKDSLAHKGSRNSLIGVNPSKKNIKLFSNETQVSKKTPPTFLVHAKDDKTVPYQNSVVFYDALIKKGLKSEMHLYEKGGHGFGLLNATSPDGWMDWLKVWMNKVVMERR